MAEKLKDPSQLLMLMAAGEIPSYLVPNKEAFRLPEEEMEIHEAVKTSGGQRGTILVRAPTGDVYFIKNIS